LRESKDLDVLVPDVDFAAARRCLGEIGWRAKTGDSHLSPRQSEFRLRHEHHVSFAHTGRWGELELHRRHRWESSDSPELPTASIRSQWQGCDYEAMSVVDLTVDLCGHGGSHAWFRAKWLGDVARIFAEGRVDAGAVLEKARSSGQERAFLQCVALLRLAYMLPVPEAIDREVLTLDSFLVERAVEKLTDPAEPHWEPGVKGVRDRLLTAMYECRLWPRKSRRAIFEGVAISPADFESIRLSDRLFWLYVPLRLILWVWRHRRAWRREAVLTDVG
jgi:hypothetical protein